MRASVLAIMLGALGCRTPCAADEQASREQLAREQKAVFRGQGICLELTSPKLALVSDRLTLTATKENVLARRSDLPITELGRVEPLHEKLKRYKDHFKAVRAADGFHPTLHVELDPSLEPVRAAALFATAASAGYPHSRVTTSNVALDFDWWVNKTPPSPLHVLCVEPHGGGRTTLRFEGGEPHPPREAPSLGALPSELAGSCDGQNPCAQLIAIREGENLPFGEVARTAATILSSPPFVDRKPPLLIVTRAPLAGDWASAPRPCGP